MSEQMDQAQQMMDETEQVYKKLWSLATPTHLTSEERIKLSSACLRATGQIMMGRTIAQAIDRIDERDRENG